MRGSLAEDFARIARAASISSIDLSFLYNPQFLTMVLKHRFVKTGRLAGSAAEFTFNLRRSRDGI